LRLEAVPVASWETNAVDVTRVEGERLEAALWKLWKHACPFLCLGPHRHAGSVQARSIVIWVPPCCRLINWMSWPLTWPMRTMPLK
jgi:hypothetical protein